MVSLFVPMQGWAVAAGVRQRHGLATSVSFDILLSAFAICPSANAASPAHFAKSGDAATRHFVLPNGPGV
jgi:hypothetical protein